MSPKNKTKQKSRTGSACKRTTYPTAAAAAADDDDDDDDDVDVTDVARVSFPLCKLFSIRQNLFFIVHCKRQIFVRDGLGGGGGWSLNSLINATFKISYIFGKNENSILNRARKKKNIIKGGKCNKSSSDDVIDRRMTSAQGERDVTRRQLPAASTTRNGISKMFTLGPKNKKQKQKTIN